MTDVIACPVCKSRDLKLFQSCEDHTVSHETFTIFRCEVCGLGITSPRPDEEQLVKYYQSDEYISHSGKTSGGVGVLYRIARLFALRWKRKIVSVKCSGKTILDFGCGTGEFLHNLKEYGWGVEGVELSDIGQKKSSTLLGQQIHTTLSEIGNKQFDVITAWHVVEHIAGLNATLEQLKNNLKKDGTIFIAVPNYESADSRYYQQHWAGYDVPRHLWHFTKNSMTKLLTEHGFSLITIKPMKLDSFYVSMLSEKYRSKNPSAVKNLLGGFLSGLRSNLAAREQNNYSSLIYIAKLA